MTKYDVGDKELNKAIDNFQPSQFTNLLQFSAKCCDVKLNKFLSILIKRSHKLQDITIEKCTTLAHLFDLNELTPHEDGHDKYFKQIQKLILIELYQLTCIWNKDPVKIFGLENMKIIHVKSCSALKDLFTPAAAEKLHQLNELKLEACEMLEKVVEDGVIQIIKFPALTNVEFKSLSKLSYFYSNPLEFPNMKTLRIEKCPQLKEYTTGFATTNASHIIEGNSFSELNELMLDSCDNLVFVVSSLTLQEFRNLKKLTVSQCEALKMVFNIHAEVYYSSTELLQQLYELILTDLPKLTHIINKEVSKFCQNMQILQVRQCNSLNWIPGSIMLTKLEISNCDALEKIMIINKED